MGQTLTSSNLLNGRESPPLSSPSTPDPEFTNTRVVISQELLTNGDESSASSSSSTPAEDIANKVGNSSASKAPLMMEAFIKTFEQLAVQQWPTWAKRRGWITDYSDEPSSEILPPDLGDENCETFIEEGIQRSAGPNEVFTSTDPRANTNDSDSDEIPRDMDEGQPRMKNESLRETAIAPEDVSKVETDQLRNDQTASSKKEATINLAHLYEMSLRWIFEPDMLGKDISFDDFPLECAAANVCEDLSNATKEELCTLEPTNTIRIYIRLLRKSGTEISFIDFRPASSIPSTNSEQTSASPNYNYGTKEENYFIELTKEESKIPLSFPRDVSCSDLILKIVTVHPMLNDCKAEQLAIYEKCWLSGKTSRARLRRLNELERPFVLASQWALGSALHGDENSTVPMTRALVLQECQTGDISWGEFSLVELRNFLKVLEREEASHEFYIRQKYQHLAQVLKLAIQTANKKA